MSAGMNELQEQLGKVAFPDTPEDRDEAESAIRAMLAAAWDEGSIAGWVESGLPHSWAAENALVKANPYRS